MQYAYSVLRPRGFVGGVKVTKVGSLKYTWDWLTFIIGDYIYGRGDPFLITLFIQLYDVQIVFE